MTPNPRLRKKSQCKTFVFYQKNFILVVFPVSNCGNLDTATQRLNIWCLFTLHGLSECNGVSEIMVSADIEVSEPVFLSAR